MNTRTIVFRNTISVVALLLLMGCSGTDPTVFQHNLYGKPTPWTHNRFDNAEDKFTFAIFSDLNGGEREKVFEVAVAQLSLLRPELILSVGDLINGGTENRETLRREWESFDLKAFRAVAPIFKVGGNHDLTNLTMRDVWMERYGARYYHFIYKNVLFLALDSEDYSDDRIQEIYEARIEYIELRDSMEPEQVKEMKYIKVPERATGEVGKEQSDYFLKVIAEHPNVDWTFLFMHKPVWLRGNDSEFAAIESALSNRPYTLFNGHRHKYSHRIKNGRDYITLGTTGGSQNASNEMSFDHVTMVTMTKDGPTIGNLRLDGILNKMGHIPANGDTLCFQASKCKED